MNSKFTASNTEVSAQRKSVCVKAFSYAFYGEIEFLCFQFLFLIFIFQSGECRIEYGSRSIITKHFWESEPEINL